MLEKIQRRIKERTNEKEKVIKFISGFCDGSIYVYRMQRSE